VSTGWGYALLCVPVPALWGPVMVAVSERLGSQDQASTRARNSVMSCHERRSASAS
jgi:hypothetical protein